MSVLIQRSDCVAGESGDVVVAIIWMRRDEEFASEEDKRKGCASLGRNDASQFPPPTKFREEQAAIHFWQAILSASNIFWTKRNRA